MEELKKLLVKNAKELKDIDNKISHYSDSDEVSFLHERKKEIVKNQTKLLKDLHNKGEK